MKKKPANLHLAYAVKQNRLNEATRGKHGMTQVQLYQRLTKGFIPLRLKSLFNAIESSDKKSIF